MDWILQRYSKGNDSTQGLVLQKDTPIPSFFCHVIEDDDQGEKGSKRIPAGFYELKIHAQETPKTLIFRKSLPWFKFFIEVTGIPNFSLVFVHPGNDQADTEGCLLLNDQMGNNTIQKDKEGGLSRQACERWYSIVYPHLEKGGKSFIEIRDEQTLK